MHALWFFKILAKPQSKAVQIQNSEVTDKKSDLTIQGKRRDFWKSRQNDDAWFTDSQSCECLMQRARLLNLWIQSLRSCFHVCSLVQTDVACLLWQNSHSCFDEIFGDSPHFTGCWPPSFRKLTISTTFSTESTPMCVTPSTRTPFTESNLIAKSCFELRLCAAVRGSTSRSCTLSLYISMTDSRKEYSNLTPKQSQVEQDFSHHSHSLVYRKKSVKLVPEVNLWSCIVSRIPLTNRNYAPIQDEISRSVEN